MELNTNLTKEEQKIQDAWANQPYEDNDTMTHSYFINSMTEEEREEYYYDLRQQKYNLWRKLS